MISCNLFLTHLYGSKLLFTKYLLLFSFCNDPGGPKAPYLPLGQKVTSLSVSAPLAKVGSVTRMSVGRIPVDALNLVSSPDNLSPIWLSDQPRGTLRVKFPLPHTVHT